MALLTCLMLAASLLVSQACSSDPPPAERPAEPVAQPVAPEQPPPPKPEQPPAPEPVPPEDPAKKLAIDLPALDNTCKADGECLPAPGCCPIPCTPNVINKSALPEARRRLDALCPEVLECGHAGGCRNHAYLCVEGTCALVFQGDKHYRKRR